MKHLFLSVAATAVLALTACTNAPESDKATTSDAKEVTEVAGGEVWKVDTTASKVEWIGTKVTGYHSGIIPIETGELQVKDGNIAGGNFVMDMNGMLVTGPKGSNADANNKLLGHLKSADFFDVTAHSDASFVITAVKPYSGPAVQEENDPRQEEISRYRVTNPTHTVSGNLTIKGVTKGIEFPARITINGSSVDAIAKFNIDRSQWNITYPGKPDDLIRNDVHMGIALKASK